jgi:hypothetical protein
VRATDVVEGEVAEPAAAPRASSPDAARTLQRAIGNAAMARLVSRSRPSRTPPPREPSPTAEDHSAAAATLSRAVAARRMIQRDITPVPPYRPDPPWSQVGPKNPSPTCTPYWGFLGFSADAAQIWRLLYSIIDAPKSLGDRCGCETVRTAFDLYMRAQVPKSMRKFTLADNGNCVSEQLAKSKTHVDLEDSLLQKWSAMKSKIPQILAGAREAEIDLIEATDFGRIVANDASRTLTQKNVDTDITYTENKLAGGLLFGGASSTGETTDDSEFGPDTRRVAGTIKLRRYDDGSNAGWMSVEQTITFKYSIHDALDFCPGNTLQKTGWTLDRLEYNEIITDFSRLEASGMARDVSFDVDYHRTTTFTSEIPLSP